MKLLIIFIFIFINYCYCSSSGSGGNSNNDRLGVIKGISDIQQSMNNFDKDGCPLVFGRLVEQSNSFNSNILSRYLSKHGNGGNNNEYTYMNHHIRPKIEALIYEGGYLLSRCSAKDYDNGHLSLERLYRCRDFLKEWNSTLELMKGIIASESYVPIIYGLSRVKASNSIVDCPDTVTPLKSFRDCHDSYCPEMIVIPTGSFIMGGTDEEHKALGVDPSVWKWDQPQHRVTFKKRFAIGKYEVTIKQFREFIKETGHKMPIGATTVEKRYNNRTGTYDTRVAFQQDLHFDSPGEGFSQTENHPMVAVRREDAREFAKWLSIKTKQTYRLPYESEWEYVARANQGYHYYIWGNNTQDACKYANVFDIDSWSHYSFKFVHFNCSDGELASSRVGKYLPNQFGVYDMLANAREWVDDHWHYGYEGAPTDGSRWGAENNGLPNFGVLRGGSFYYNTFNVRIAYRNSYFSSQSRSVMWGFRLVREIN